MLRQVQNQTSGGSGGNLTVGSAAEKSALADPLSQLRIASRSIHRESMLVVSKLSKVEFDMRQYRVNEVELRCLYAGGGEDSERIFASHRRQKAARKELEQIISPDQIVGRDEISKSRVKKFAAVIAFGGDNHFQHVSHFLGDIPVLGLNSDPQTSHGALLTQSVSTLETALKKLEQGAYVIEPWTRLSLQIDRRSYPLALCDVFFGEEKRVLMSKYTLQVFRRHSSGILLPITPAVEQKSSGLLVASGAGSTGWFRTVARQFSNAQETFVPSDNFAKFAATEVSYTQAQDHPEMLLGRIESGDVLRVVSLNRAKGIVSLDSLVGARFSRGTTADLRIANMPLSVIQPL